MSSKSGITLNVKSAIGDFRKYDKATQQRFARTLGGFAFNVKDKQHSILKKGVLGNPTGKWTGRLAGSLSPEKQNKFTWAIGTDDSRVSYASWIEDGGRGGFKGYHYIRNSLKGIKSKLTAALKKDIDAGS